MTFQIKRSVLAVSVAAAIVAPLSAVATNGMLLEGYGPIATGMGGASMAYDNGVAAVMNNPATLGMMEDGEARLDVALGNLAPDITATHPLAGDADSAATSFFMPAVGYAVRNESLTYGVGMFAQGGMGTEYASASAVDPSMGGTGDVSRSEVGVGRLVAPIVYNVNKNLSVGGSIDYVFGGMDLMMAMPGDATGFGDFIDTAVTVGGFNISGAHNGGIASGSLVDGLAGAMDAGGISGVNWVNFNFSDDSDYTGDAKGAGITGKIGMTFKVNNNLTVGATYHAKTAMSDLETSNATVSMNVDGDGGFLTTGTPDGNPVIGQTVDLTGKLSVNDFQFPAQIGLGMAYQQDKWMVAADVKIIQWADVMDSFRMTFTADAVPTNGMFGGASMDVEMYQNWEDQTVIQIGGAYKVSSATTLRAGINSSSNPVPDATMNHLFPATIENHYTLGVGQAMGKTSSIDFSLTIAPEVEVVAGSTVTTTHAQTNWQLMYSQKF
ncbi:MAG: outer membrane protein transport protein [Gammaproteobacteria bacterium]|nr:outer membrane protein transport protein [Gammaproteobacteria bacterium]